MEFYEINLKDGKFNIEGFPEAVKVITLRGRDAVRAADLTLHRNDLLLARGCLDKLLNKEIDLNDPTVEALWRTAVINTMKCFGVSGGRGQLNADKILKGNKDGLDVFDYFKNLRDKHLVHDENPYDTAQPLAVINAENDPNRIAKILTVRVTAITLEQITASNLDHLINVTLEWVNKEFDLLCAKITADLEKLPYSTLMSEPDAEYISKPRNAVFIRKSRPI